MNINDRLFASKQQLSRIRHRHLNCFLEAARSRKVSAAAYALNISQPAASKTLSELEAILDTKLFERGGRGGLRLTSTGTVFLRFAGASIAALKEGLDGIAQARMHEEPVLMIVVGRLARPKEMAGLSFIHLYSEELVFVVRPGHPLADGKSFNPALLENMTLLMPTADGVMRPVVDRFLIAHGVGNLSNSIEARSNA